jgi:hypothetical protein
MRFTKKEESFYVADVIEILTSYTAGLPTKDLLGTKHFHGSKTLTSKQVHRILNKQPEIERSWQGSGYYGSSWWKLKK